MAPTTPTSIGKPTRRPLRPQFSSGPCAKRPGWSLAALADASLGRSHRAGDARRRLREVIDRSRDLLGLPDGWRVGIVPGSDTGAFEMALWSLLGPRPVEVLTWESFGAAWARDVTSQLRLDAQLREAPYGELPDLAKVDFERDVVFTWNGTTSGVRVPDGAWIPDDRRGLVLCDATSAVFAMDVAWEKLDVATWSWQKVLGGEAAHGMLALSPRAVERLESHTPSWPLPKIFRLTQGGRLNEGIFEGSTINTPSMLCVEDALDGLRWAEAQGGLDALVARSRSNLEAVAAWVETSPWVDFLARATETRSSTSICLRVADAGFAALDEGAQRKTLGRLTRQLEEERVAYDIGGYRDAPPGLRLWGGATVERDDLCALFPWLDWAWAEIGSDA